MCPLGWKLGWAMSKLSELAAVPGPLANEGDKLLASPPNPELGPVANEDPELGPAANEGDKLLAELPGANESPEPE